MEEDSQQMQIEVDDTQTTHILKDLAYIINFGHFPAERKIQHDTNVKTAEEQEGGTPSSTTNSQDEEQTDNTKSLQEENSETERDKTPSQSKNVSTPTACDVTRDDVQNLIQEAFEINQQDFNSIKEEIAINKATPVVELVMNHLEGDALPAATLYFIRALLNSHQTFTKIYRPPTVNGPTLTNITAHWEQSLNLPIENIYKDSVTLEVWLGTDRPVNPVLRGLENLIKKGSMRIKNKELIAKLNTSSPTEQTEEGDECHANIESNEMDTIDNSQCMTPQSHRKSFKMASKSVEKKAKKLIRRVSSVGNKDRLDKYMTSKEDISNLSQESMDTPKRIRSSSMATLYTDEDNIATSTPRRNKLGFSSLRLKAGQKVSVITDLAKTTLNPSKRSFGSSVSLASSISDSPGVERSTPPPRPPRPAKPPRPPPPNIAHSPNLSLTNNGKHSTSNPFHEDDEVDEYPEDHNPFNSPNDDSFTMSERRLRRLTEIDELDDQNPFKDDSVNVSNKSDDLINQEIKDDDPFDEIKKKDETTNPFEDAEVGNEEIFKKVSMKSKDFENNTKILEKVRRDENLQMKPVTEKIETHGGLQKSRYEYEKEKSVSNSQLSIKKDLKQRSEKMTQKFKRYVSREKLSQQQENYERNGIHDEDDIGIKTQIDYSGKEICIDHYSALNKSSLSIGNSSTSSLNDHTYSDDHYNIDHQQQSRQRHPSIGNLDDTDFSYRKKKKEHDTMSLASFRKKAGSIRLSPDKVKNAFKKIGSIRNLSPRKDNSKYMEESTLDENQTSSRKEGSINSLQRTTSVPVLPKRSYSLRLPSKGGNLLKQFGSLRRRPSNIYPASQDIEINDDTESISGDIISGETEEAYYEGEIKEEEEIDNNRPEVEEVVNKGPIQEFLESEGEFNIQEHCIGQIDIKLKDFLWSRESKDRYSIATYTGKETQNSFTSNKIGRTRSSENESLSTSCVAVHCYLEIKADIVSQAYQVYYNTFQRIAKVSIENKDVNDVFNGSVGAVGDMLLEQIVFFWNVSQPHRALAHWLVLAKIDKVDAGCLLGWLKQIKEALESTKYEPTQEQTLARSLCQWVLKIVEEEFEHLHSSFKLTSEYIEIQRLENILRCFAIIESSGSLRCAFERQSQQYSMGGARECLEGGITKHTELWVNALQKEMLEPHKEDITIQKHSRQLSTSSTVKHSRELSISSISEEVGPSPKLVRSVSMSKARADARKEAEGEEWLELMRRASVLMDPVLSFITISVQTYQPIFKKELGVDYVYLIWPKLLSAAVYLIKPLYQKRQKDIIQMISEERLTVAVSAAWDLCAHLSQINKLGKSESLPPHLVPQLYHPGFTTCVEQWLNLSSRLAIHGINNDIEQENFESRDESCFGDSAKGAGDLISALCGRLGGICWMDDIPDHTVISSAYEQIDNLLTHYSAKLTNQFTNFLQLGKISEKMCLVIGSVSYVCERATHALSQRLGMEKEEKDHHYHNELIISTARALIQMCLPDLQKDIKKMININDMTAGVEGGVGGVTVGTRKESITSPFNPKKVITIIEEALVPVENQLYLAEKLIDQLWKHFSICIQNIQKRLNQKSNCSYEEYRRLGQILSTAHNFLTSSNGVGFKLTKEDVEVYERLSEDLKLQGATQEELLAQYFQERYEEQQKIEYELASCLIVNVVFENQNLCVHVIQGPGYHQGALVKARVTPDEWFPRIDAQKTASSKKDPAVYDEEFIFNVNPECDGVKNGGFLVLQVRTQKLGRTTVVHGECFLPLRGLRSISKDQRNSVKHQRLLLSKPHAIENYASLRHLQRRAAVDKSARAFLTDLEKKMGI